MMYMLIWSSIFLTGEMSHQEKSKSKDLRQCTLCQQYGDCAPTVSVTVLSQIVLSVCMKVHEGLHGGNFVIKG